jgi:hypothetical protein
LFGSDLLHPGDAAFLADALGKGGVAAAVAGHADDSLLAGLAAECSRDGHVDADAARARVTALRGELLESMRARSGREMAFHRTFAESAVVGALRGLGVLALREGDKLGGGTLLKAAEARDHSAAWVWESVLQLAAWDAGNAQATRPADALHRVARLDPRFEVVRFALDRMQLRTHVPGTPD